MSEIPDEVVDRVAAAIAEAEGYISDQDPITFVPLKWEHLDEPGPEREHARKLARAALRECGWAEMIKAMTMMSAACTRYDEKPDSTIAQAYYQQALADLRSALSKAKGEGQ